jgi:superfamily II DNA or RNA helicase
MQIPFVIDNQQYKMAEVLNSILAQHHGKSLDIATAYFNVGGWQLLRDGLKGLGSFRLLLGDEPEAGSDLGLREIGAKPVKGLIRDLANSIFNPQTLMLVEDLIAYLRRENVEVRRYTKGFLHAKCYLFYSGGGFDRLNPVAAIVGSSNFTRPGLTTNKELNLSHRANLSPEEIGPEQVKGLLEAPERKQLALLGDTERLLASNVPGVLAINELSQWYDRQWDDSHDFKDELIELLDASKFGRKEYAPYQVYLKSVFEYFRDELDADTENGPTNVRSTVELSEFQEDAVKKARKILARYDGVMIADSVGLGKTWIGKKLLEDYAYHLRYKAVVICPAALRKMWENELYQASITARIITQEMVGQEGFDIREVQDADLVLIDESHNFRNKNAQRYENLERLLAANNRRGGSSGERKKVILLTATPINNTVLDLYHQVNLFTGGDRSYFAAAGIGDLYKYFIAARRANRQQDTGIALFNLLEEIAIRRTRPFIKLAYPNATIKGEKISWPERKLKTIRYNLEATYSGIYKLIVSRIESLRLTPYRLETYKKQGVNRDQFEEGREEALVGIFKSRYLKRFESSIDAFRISVRRALEFLETFESYLMEDKVLDSASFQKAMRFLAREDEEDDATTPGTLSDNLDANAEARQYIETLPLLDASKYDLKRLHNDLRKDVKALQEVWQAIEPIKAAQDAKLNRLKELLAGELKGQKVLLFTYYKDTARYIYRELCSADAGAVEWRERAGHPNIRRMDSGADTKERATLVAQFAPVANGQPNLAGTDKEIDIMISTDVLSEGQNLQDCGVLINYDLHWNPTRMVQRAGRIDRIGTSFDTLLIHNMFPDDGLEELLGLVQSLSAKIANIDQAGLLDASVLGEVVHPQNFNTLRRIEEEDGKVVEEQEQFVELVSSEFMLQTLKGILDDQKRQMLEDLPDGIHSGLAREGAKGVFFYFTADGENKKPRRGKGKSSSQNQLGSNGSSNNKSNRQHFWRYVDLADNPKGESIQDNRYLITNLIQCQPDTPRVVPTDFEVDIFALQEKVIASIVQSAVEQVAVEEAPKILDPIQQTIATTLRGYINSPTVSRNEIIAAIQKLNEPQPGVYIKALRKAYDEFIASGKLDDLLNAVKSVAGAESVGARDNQSSPTDSETNNSPIKREDLRLICFDYIWQ